jgi:uncharacterized cupin superfamily protein
VSERVVNLLELALSTDPSFPEGHRLSGESLTGRFGATETGMGVYELAPGEASWPYHFELAQEEWLIVISGELTLRTPEGERVLDAGDVACFPAGAPGAHAVRNHGDAVVRYAMPSRNDLYARAAVFPDSGKFSFGTTGFHHRGRLGEAVEYWEGEP